MHPSHVKGFIPYGLAAFLVSLIGGFSTLLGPSFVEEIGFSYNNTTWTALSAAVSTAAFAPVMGKISDVFGRKKTLLFGLLLFTVGNALSALAASLAFMLVARFLTGVGSAAIAPVVISYILTEFPKDSTAKGFSLYMLISSSAVIFGPTLSGLIVEAFDWRIMMWICTGICFFVFLACLFFPEPHNPSAHSLKEFDLAGSFLILLSFGMLLCIPSFGQNFGWTSSLFLTVLILSVLSFLLLAVTEKKAENPILSGPFMKRKTFLLTVLVLFLTQGLMQANMTNTIIFVNYTQPGNTMLSGYSLSIMYFGMSLGSILLGPLADKWEPKYILTSALSITGTGCALMLFFHADTSFLLLAMSLGLLGFGLGASATIYLKIVLSGLSPQESGSGTGTYGLFRDLAAPFGVAVFVPMFTNQITDQILLHVPEAEAAVSAIQNLAIIEIFCVILGILIVQFLPRIYKGQRF